MKHIGRQIAIWFLTTSCSCLAASAAAEMTVSSFDGAVTSDELQSFNSFMAAAQPASDNIGNTWAQGTSGEQTKAMAMVYSIAGQRETLDQMLRFCDAVLSQRNDLAKAPVGQHVIWTGTVAPVWPNNITASPIGTGGEQGDPVGHLASCAHLILTNKDLYGEQVTTGDEHGYGASYLERAKTYLKQADAAMTGHVLSRVLDLSADGKMYFAKDSPYKGGMPVPWNQQMMFNYAFQNLVAAHGILGSDDGGLSANYTAIMNASLRWFFDGGGSKVKKSSKGSTVYDWDYGFGTRVEDTNHAALDVAGFYRAYDSKWPVTKAQMTIFANTFVDVITVGDGKYAGTVEGKCGTGHASCIDYVRSAFLLLAEFRPDAYRAMVSADLKEGGTTSKADVFSRFLWAKHRRNAAA